MPENERRAPCNALYEFGVELPKPTRSVRMRNNELLPNKIQLFAGQVLDVVDDADKRPNQCALRDPLIFDEPFYVDAHLFKWLKEPFPSKNFILLPK